jgi:hypothetical protein
LSKKNKKKQVSSPSPFSVSTLCFVVAIAVKNYPNSSSGTRMEAINLVGYSLTGQQPFRTRAHLPYGTGSER